MLWSSYWRGAENVALADIGVYAREVQKRVVGVLEEGARWDCPEVVALEAPPPLEQRRRVLQLLDVIGGLAMSCSDA